jgi:diacylglycerol O-acyltransferase / wax synthase
VKRLSGSDAVFLSMERPTWQQHVGGLLVFDRANAPDFTFENFSRLVVERLPLAPRFACRVKEVPFGLDRPLWVRDPDLDVTDHVHRVAVPAPGGPHQLASLTSYLMADPLDRGRPLWDIWFIEGLEGDQGALLCKTHHCMMDGISGQGLAAYLFDLEAAPPPRPIPPAAEEEPPPSDFELFARGLLPSLATPWTAARYVAELAGRGLALLPFLRGERRASTPLDAPPTPWNASLSSLREFAFAKVSLDKTRRLARRLDVKVNDVVLSVVTSVLRDYLLSVDALPDKPLVCGVPVSTRGADDVEIGNQFGTMFVGLPVAEPDPLVRLELVHDSANRGKEMVRAAHAHPIHSIGESAPPAVLNLAFEAMSAWHLDQRVPAAANLLMSNIPGPPFPLYSAGAQMVAMYPIGPLMMGMGLNCTAISYQRDIDVGVQCDPELLPNPWPIVDGLPGALHELGRAARRNHRTAKAA